jgi:hypothetical protein
VKHDRELKSYEVFHYQPFNPVHKRTEAKIKGARLDEQPALALRAVGSLH